MTHINIKLVLFLLNNVLYYLHKLQYIFRAIFIFWVGFQKKTKSIHLLFCFVYVSASSSTRHYICRIQELVLKHFDLYQLKNHHNIYVILQKWELTVLAMTLCTVIILWSQCLFRRLQIGNFKKGSFIEKKGANKKCNILIECLVAFKYFRFIINEDHCET